MKKRIALLVAECYVFFALVKLSAWLLNQPNDFSMIASITLLIVLAVALPYRAIAHINFFRGLVK